MDKPKVIARPVDIKGKTGLDILVADPNASVADYLSAVDGFISRAPVERSRSQGSPCCLGCYACCQERIPLTSIDYDRLFTHHLAKAEEQPWRRFLDKISLISVKGRQVDITMRLDQEGLCIYLDRNKGLCSIYPIRPLVCRTYICAPLSKNAMDLRELVVNLGEDELVRLWLEDAAQVKEIPAYHEGDQPDLRIEDWGESPFSGKKDYRDVLLKDLCTPGLWNRLSL
ncbi:MAG: YkgJ family cysteine cluster protein [Bacillota bacterium]